MPETTEIKRPRYARAIEIEISTGVFTYGVQCPECQKQFAGKGRTEDSITKSASRAYAEHWVLNHA